MAEHQDNEIVNTKVNAEKPLTLKLYIETYISYRGTGICI
jgi:hypothetical protein